jgi:preprotein translocase subunit SecG
MEFLFPVLLSVHILVGLGVIGLVLLQHGKGADRGAAFGSGASGSLFGASGSANFLSRVTAILAAVFFFTSLGLSYLSSNKPKAPESVMEAPLGTPPAGGAVTVPLPSGQPADVPVPSGTPAAPAAEQKPAAGAEDKPATENAPAPASEAKEGVKESGAAEEAKAPVAAEVKPEQKSGAKQERKAAEKPAEKASSKASAKGEKDAAASKAGTEAPASESKAKDIPK